MSITNPELTPPSLPVKSSPFETQRSGQNGRQQNVGVAKHIAILNESLRQREERFRLLVDSVRDYAIFMLSPEGKILSWNLGAERIKGYRAEEIIGQHFSILYTPEDAQSGRPERGLKIAAREGRYEDEGWRVRKDGSRFWANVIITALFDAARNLTGFAKVTRDITERKQKEEEIRQLSARLLRAHDEERRRLGRELHDSTGQTLSAIGINVALLEQCVDVSTNPKVAKILSELTELAEQGAREIRSLAYLLHPPMLEEAGLACALRWYVGGFTNRTGIEVKLAVAPGLEGFSDPIDLALFRIVQESLTNIYRHSGSPTALVRLGLEKGDITLEVSDKGKGFGTTGSPGRGANLFPRGVGINGMHERMRQLNGRLEIITHKAGTTVRAVVPLRAGQSHSATSVAAMPTVGVAVPRAKDNVPNLA
jgi:PAS domain S-box-containing protein